MRNLKTLFPLGLIFVILVAGCTQTGEYISVEEHNFTVREKEQQIENLQQNVTNLQQEIIDSEEFNKYYTKALTKYNYGFFDNSDAEYNYYLWGWYYDDNYYYDSIEYCEAARELYFSSSAYYQDAITYFEEANKTAKAKYHELIDYYIKISDMAIDMNWAMYETCEYYESACDYYDQGLWNAGDNQIEEGAKKIDIFDGLVRTYNQYISKIEMLEEKL